MFYYMCQKECGKVVPDPLAESDKHKIWSVLEGHPLSMPTNVWLMSVNAFVSHLAD